MGFELGARRGVYRDIADGRTTRPEPLSAEELDHFETFDLIYRSLCTLLYNYVPTSGHPGGSISSGRIVAGILFDSMDYDVSNPDREDADLLSYAAGHKALGLYAMWALRNEVIRIGAPELLPRDLASQLRLEDLLGFRRNPTTETPLFRGFRAKALDGHPTPATPFLRLSTGASGVGVPASIGLALGAMDYFGADDPPRVHILEGEGGMTPGRVSEALAAAGTASLGNLILHVDWNQASIDSNRVCRDSDGPGDYVQWNPVELLRLHDWNVIFVPDGMNLQQVFAGQRAALCLDNGQPTAVVYRTTKGWRYGIEGKASHGAGHKLCADGFYQAVAPLLERTGGRLPRCEANASRCGEGREEAVVEECFWEALGVIRDSMERHPRMVEALARGLVRSREWLDGRGRRPRSDGPRVEAVYEEARAVREGAARKIPLPGSSTTLRSELGSVLNDYNRASGGALFVAAADLLGSTSVGLAAAGFPEGYYNARIRPGSRLLSAGGICEDAMAALLAGLSSYGRHLGIGSSYGAFLAPLGHIAARLHAIGCQARKELRDEPCRPFFLICAHAGLKTGEDGPTHADPQALQLLQGNFPPGTMITLTPWEPQEIRTLIAVALLRRPAVIAPFVTRPAEVVPDRTKRGLAPAGDSATGVYRLRRASGRGDGTLILQESGVTYAFVEQTLPLLEEKGIDLDAYYVASAELFDGLPPEEQERIFPEARGREAMGITGFTLPTLYRWVTSDWGRAMTLHPFRKGHYLGSGPAEKVLAEAGLDGESQFKAIRRFLEKRRSRVA